MQLLIVWHSKTGGTRAMVDAAVAGASVADDVAVVSKQAQDADAEDLLRAQGYLFAAPENLAAIAGVMKDFYDRTYYPVLGKIEGRPYAQMVCAGSDGENAVKQTARIAQGWRLKPVAEPIIVCSHAQTPEQILAPKTIAPGDVARCRELGATLAAGLDAGIF